MLLSWEEADLSVGLYPGDKPPSVRVNQLEGVNSCIPAVKDDIRQFWDQRCGNQREEDGNGNTIREWLIRCHPQPYGELPNTADRQD